VTTTIRNLRRAGGVKIMVDSEIAAASEIRDLSVTKV
jgi:hypothetical protein